MLSKMTTTGHSFIVWHRFAKPDFTEYDDEMTVDLLGGYTAGKDTIILFRYPPEMGNLKDGSMRLFPNHRISPVTNDLLALNVDTEDYDRFADLAIGARFKLGGRMWTKRHPDDIAKMIGGRVYAE